MHKWLIICVIVHYQLLCFTKSELLKDYCQQQCMSVDNCKGFRDLPVEVQQKLLINYSCNNAQSTFFGISSNGGKSICCPKSDVVALLNSNEQNVLNPPLNNYNANTLKNEHPTVSNVNTNLNLSKIIPSESDQDDLKFGDDTDEGNKIYPINNRRNNIDRQRPIKKQSPQTSNFTQLHNNYPRRDDFKRSVKSSLNNFQNIFPNNNYNFLNENYPNNKNYKLPIDQNNKAYRDNQFENKGNNCNQNIAPRPNFIGRCDVSTLNHIPPAPSSGCCGRDASDNNFEPSGEVPSQPNRQFSIDPTQNWATHINQRGVPNVFSPRYKRDENASVAASKVNFTIDSRITSGTETEPEDYPWTALILTLFDYGIDEALFYCGGSLISNRFILTAAHCVSKPNAKLTQLKIHLAEYDKRTFPVDCKNGVDGRKCVENIVMYAENVIPHPAYDINLLQNDIALIKLRGTAPYTDFIRPICLTPFDIDNPNLKSLHLIVAGWGNKGNYISNIKQATVINLVPQWECNRHFYPYLTPTHLCAVGYSGEDTCKGDSGGPVMMLYEGQYFLTGIISGKRTDFPCGAAVPSLYTNVYNYLAWIK